MSGRITSGSYHKDTPEVQYQSGELYPDKVGQKHELMDNGVKEFKPKCTRKYRRTSSHRTSYFLWEFLLALLFDEDATDLIEWTDKSHKIFKIYDLQEVAILWGTLKNKHRLGKEALLRSIRYYYKDRRLQRLNDAENTYQFLNIPVPFLYENVDQDCQTHVHDG